MSATKISPPILAVTTSALLLAAWVSLSPPTHAAPATLNTATPMSTLTVTATATSMVSATATPTGTESSPAGRLRFADNEKVPTGSFDLQIDAMVPPPDGTHYELWLRGGAGDLLDLGALPAETEGIDYSGSTEKPLLASYDSALVSVEPDEDSDPAMSDQIVLSGTLPAGLLPPIQHLFVGSELHSKGYLWGAAEQMKSAVEHGGFVTEALAGDEMAAAQRHAEHVINIIVGEHSMFFNDWDRSGYPPENPGDGYGVITYLEDVVKQAGILSDTLATEPDAARVLPLLAQVITSANQGHELANHATEAALKIFTADTSKEAQSFADDVTEDLDKGQQEIDAAYQAALEVAELRLFAQQSPSTQTPTLEPTETPTSEPTEAPTLVPAQTPTPESTQTAAAGEDAPTAESTPITAVTTTTAELTSTLVVSPAVDGSTTLVDSGTGKGWVNAKDGGVYEYVPGGEFTMGADAANAVAEQEQPAHAVSVDGFWLQRTEVTNAQYTRCVADGACTPPQVEGWDAPELADHPVSYVDWQQANDYARWAGGRLPTEAEWERACRGDDTRLYPWGDQPPTPETANFGNNTGDTLPVGSLPAGASPYGILDLSGNVWEWTSSLEQPYPYAADDGREDPTADGKRTARGGSFYYTQYQARCTARSGFAPTTANPNFGLRVLLQQDGTQ